MYKKKDEEPNYAHVHEKQKQKKKAKERPFDDKPLPKSTVSLTALFCHNINFRNDMKNYGMEFFCT